MDAGEFAVDAAIGEALAALDPRVAVADFFIAAGFEFDDAWHGSGRVPVSVDWV